MDSEVDCDVCAASCAAMQLTAHSASEETLEPGSLDFWLMLTASLALTVAAGLFSGLTVGFMSLDRMQLDVLAREGCEADKRRARLVLPLLERHNLLLATLVIANAAAYEALPLAFDRVAPLSVSLTLSVTLVVIFGEILPQAVATGPTRLAISAFFAPMVRVLMAVELVAAWPIAKLMDFLIGEDSSTLFRRSELRALIELHAHSEGGGGNGGGRAGGGSQVSLTRRPKGGGSALLQSTADMSQRKPTAPGTARSGEGVVVAGRLVVADDASLRGGAADDEADHFASDESRVSPQPLSRMSAATTAGAPVGVDQIAVSVAPNLTSGLSTPRVASTPTKYHVGGDGDAPHDAAFGDTSDSDRGAVGVPVGSAAAAAGATPAGMARTVAKGVPDGRGGGGGAGSDERRRPLTLKLTSYKSGRAGPGSRRSVHRTRSASSIKTRDTHSDSPPLTAREAQMIHGVIETGSKCVRDVMTPWETVYTIPADAKLDERTMAELLARGFSRVPVCDRGTTSVRGFLIVKKLIVLDPEDARIVSSLHLRAPVVTSADAAILELLSTFLKAHTHLAIVFRNAREADAVAEHIELSLNLHPHSPHVRYPADIVPVGIATIEDVLESLIREDIDDEVDASHQLREAERRLSRLVTQRVGVQRAIGQLRMMLRRARARSRATDKSVGVGSVGLPSAEYVTAADAVAAAVAGLEALEAVSVTAVAAADTEAAGATTTGPGSGSVGVGGDAGGDGGRSVDQRRAAADDGAR